MTCAWKELLSILPHRLRQDVDRLGKEKLQELRLRSGQYPQLILGKERRQIPGLITSEELQYVVNMASRYSPWNVQTLSQGYLTASGGHRIGVCGEAVMKDGQMQGIRNISSLNIRIARDFPGIANKLQMVTGSILIIGRPGSGKTTLMRDLIRGMSERCTVTVVDERSELFPIGLDPVCHADVLRGCGKGQGMDMLLRVMSPDVIAVDEITSNADCQALIRAGWCGVRLLATAHAVSCEDLLRRSVYKPLVEAGIFDMLVILQEDKSFRTERMVRMG